jgi:hypothetical protein
MPGLTFEQLVAERRNNRTLKELQADSGDVVRWNSWQQWTNPAPGRRRTQFPEVGTIKAMAVALGVTEGEVLMALGRTLGLSIDAEQDLVLPGAGALPPLAKSTLASLATVMGVQAAAEAKPDPAPEPESNGA